jgi:hypothetical protein
MRFLAALLLLAPVAVMAPPPAAHAQTFSVVGTCGTSSYTAGQFNYGTIDTTGRSCSNAAASISFPSFGSAVTTGLGIGFLTTGNLTAVTSAVGLPVNCIVGCAGGTSSNASSGVATSSTNGQNLAWNYVWNGTTWDQWKGNVGGYEFEVATTPTIQNASYVSGNCMGGFQTVAAARTSGGSGILNTVTLASKGGLATGKVIYIFGQNPSSSTCTDKGTFTLNAADIGKLLVAPFTLTPAATTGTTVSTASNQNIVASFVTSGNQNVYFAIVETATETPATTSDLILTLSGIQD